MQRQSPEIIPGPGVLSDKAQAFERAKRVVPYVDWVQIDIADGILVPSKTFLDPTGLGDMMRLPLSFELHMMVKDPFSLIGPWREIGIKRFLLHIESLMDQGNVIGAKFKHEIEKLRSENIEVGLAIDKDTTAEKLFPYLGKIDCVLVMTIKAGFSGQKFIPELLDKVKDIKKHAPDLPIEVDGGINFDTAVLSVAAGVDRLVSTSTLYNSPDIKIAIEKMKNA